MGRVVVVSVLSMIGVALLFGGATVTLLIMRDREQQARFETTQIKSDGCDTTTHIRGSDFLPSDGNTVNNIPKQEAGQEIINMSMITTAEIKVQPIAVNPKTEIATVSNTAEKTRKPSGHRSTSAHNKQQQGWSGYGKSTTYSNHNFRNGRPPYQHSHRGHNGHNGPGGPNDFGYPNAPEGPNGHNGPGGPNDFWDPDALERPNGPDGPGGPNPHVPYRNPAQMKPFGSTRRPRYPNLIRSTFRYGDARYMATHFGVDKNKFIAVAPVADPNG